MKISIGKMALLEGLQTVQNVVGLRTPLPILFNVLMKAEKNKLTLTTTDLDLTICRTVEAQVEKGGTTTLPVRRMFSIVRELPDSDISIAVDDKNTASISCGSSFFKIIGLTEEEFPAIPDAGGTFHYRVERAKFREMLNKTAYAASGDETRHILNGVLMSFKEGKLTMVATDGRRLALVEHEIEVPKEAAADVILPSKTVGELQRILGDDGELKITIKDKQAFFEFGETRVSSKLIEGTYPNYRQVIPSQSEQRIVMEREALLTALRRVVLLTTDKSNATKFTFSKNKLLISMTTPDVGEARESIPVKYSGKEITAAFNPEFMMDPLKTLASDEVILEITDELSPGVIKCEAPFLYVLMPMRVG